MHVWSFSAETAELGRMEGLEISQQPCASERKDAKSRCLVFAIRGAVKGAK